MKLPRRLRLCFWLFFAGMAMLPAQNTISFTLEHEGQPAEGRVTVTLGAPDEAGLLHLYFSNLNFSPPALNESLKLLVNKSDFTLSNARFDAAFNKTVIAPNKKTFIAIYPEGAGNVGVQLNLSQFRTPDGSPQAVKNAGVFTADFVVEAPKTDNPPPPPPPDNNPPRQNDHKNQPAAQPRPDPEAAAFNAAMAKTQRDERADALKKFISDYPNSSRKREALQFIPIEKDPNELANGVKQYKLRYSLAPRILQFDSSVIEISKNLAQEGLFHVLELRSTSPLDDTIVIFDEGKKEGFQFDTILFKGNAIFLDVRGFQKNKSQYVLYLRGGEPPFILDFYYKNERLPNLREPIQTTNDSVILQIGKIRDKWPGHGELLLTVRQRKTNEVESVETPLLVSRPINPLLFVLAGLGLVAFIVLVSRARRQARIRKVEARLKKQQEDNPEITFTDPIETATPMPPAEPLAMPAGSSGGIVKIRGIAPKQPADQKSISEAGFDSLLTGGVYHRLRPNEQWLDTVISEICLSKKAIQDLDNFLRGQFQQQLDEPEGSIPEIGGFLMGKYCFSEKNQRYRVALEEFVPIVPEENTAYQLQFSTESLVRELGDMQDKYPELAVVGWFHTHPGHGLFLSKPDLTIHDGFFREPYQFAMEIDTMSENLDTGFFTRTVSGAVNNQDALLPESRWFDWTEIEKATRRK